MPVIDAQKLIADRAGAIRAFHLEKGILKAQLDLSGGIDSAVMAGLLLEALGPENVILVFSNIHSSEEACFQAWSLADALGMSFCEAPLTQLYDGLLATFQRSIGNMYNGHNFHPKYGEGDNPVKIGYALLKQVREEIEKDPTILGSIKSTLRAPVGRAFNRMLGGIRHGTGNECEDRYIRFYQKGGDGEVDTNPIAMLSKTEVFQLAFALGQHFAKKMGSDYPIKAYESILEKTPTPDLLGPENPQTDEEELMALTGVPLTYGRVAPKTGKILSFGTLERVARGFDSSLTGHGTFSGPWGFYFFTKYETGDIFHERGWVRTLFLPQLRQENIFPQEEFTDQEVLDILQAVKKLEKATRHKMNPNIPTLGTRQDLIKAGVLTDQLTLP